VTIADNPIPVSYSVRITALHKDGSRDVIEYEDYGLLTEVLSDIEEEAARRGWYEEEKPCQQE
jgi:hypothetical protein